MASQVHNIHRGYAVMSRTQPEADINYGPAVRVFTFSLPSISFSCILSAIKAATGGCCTTRVRAIAREHQIQYQAYLLVTYSEKIVGSTYSTNIQHSSFKGGCSLLKKEAPDS